MCTRKGVKIDTVTVLNCMLMGHIASYEESVMLSHDNFQRVTHKELKEKLQSNAITAPSSGSNEHYSDSLQWAQSGELMLIKVESMQRIYMGRCVGIIYGHTAQEALNRLYSVDQGKLKAVHI